MTAYAIALVFLCGTEIDAAPAPDSIRVFFSKHCVDCHGVDEPEGGVALEGLSELSKVNVETWQKILGQIAAGEMPPKRKKRPDFLEREAVIASMTEALVKVGVKPRFLGSLLPEDGNWVDHDRLFSGYFKGPASSPPRFWRTSPRQYDALMEEFWVLPKFRYERSARREEIKHVQYGYTQAFSGMDPKQFTNYASEAHTGGDLVRSLMSISQQLADRLLSEKPKYQQDIQPVFFGDFVFGTPKEMQRFKVTPPSRPKEFDPFIDEKQSIGAAERRAVVVRLFQMFLNRAARPEEMERYDRLAKQVLDDDGRRAMVRGLILAVMISPEFVFRMELGRGETDKHGRRMLSPDELVYAIAFALTDDGPDQTLWEAARRGELKTRKDVEFQVRRILADDSIEKHRRLRFFQEFFGYPRALKVEKDVPTVPTRYVAYLVRDVDLFVERILHDDRDVFARLLTDDKFVVGYPASTKDPDLVEMMRQQTIVKTKRVIEATKKNKDPKKRAILPPKDKKYSWPWAVSQGLTPVPRTLWRNGASAEADYLSMYGIDFKTFDSSPEPIRLPGRRVGILTHPAWLYAHSVADDNDLVRRGIWIRERLLAGKIPDRPIIGDAKLIEDRRLALRERIKGTHGSNCWYCHQRINPLGYTFEIYDQNGFNREQEMVGKKIDSPDRDQPIPIDSSGALTGTGDPELDGPVKDAIELVQKLAKSSRVRQSFVRHAFRYWMGRNETLNDSPTLMAADDAYVKSDGSFNELLVSLLTSDSFIYRK